jgi:hypothetical protein
MLLGKKHLFFPYVLMWFTLLLVCICVSPVNNYVVSCLGVFATNDG